MCCFGRALPNVGSAGWIIQIDAKAFQGLEQGRKHRLVISEPADGMAVNRLANLLHAGRSHDATRRVKLQASGFPIQADVIDQAAGLNLQVADQVFVTYVEPFEGPGPSPVLEYPLVVGEPSGEVLPVVGPVDRNEVCLAADTAISRRSRPQTITLATGQSKAIKPTSSRLSGILSTTRTA